MKKLLLTLLGVSCSLVYASSPANFPINCANNVVVTESSVLSQVQKCQIIKQKTSDGIYMVKFTDINNKKYECDFATNTPSAAINHCTNG